MNADSKEQRVGFVGLGDIGEPMARRILAAGFPTTLWARREASLVPFEGMGYHRAKDRVELGRASDVVGVCVFGEKDVSEVVLGDDGILAGMAPGGVILVHSTVSTEYVVELARQCEARGVTVLDAAVSGFRQRAAAGELTVMVGGPVDTFQRVRPILETFGAHVEHLGQVGRGLAMKALNQALGLANLASSALALETGRQLGLDQGATERVLLTASGGSFAMELLVGRILKDPQFAQLVASIADKDLAVFEDLCRSAGVLSSDLGGLAARSNDAVAGLVKTP
ncbi:3-hydroxyisobutyrate dehydrogenase [Streptomyces tendae]|uniref:NAD(P)-dependent oxidoreductase n=1 Tax=Streptomyces tendae TaxID=1932 RepID=UPI003837519F